MEKIVIKLDRSHLKKLPEIPGVYFFQNEKGVTVYIGKARNLKNRVSSYFNGEPTEKVTRLISEATHISYLGVNSEFDALILEANLVQKIQPKFNVELKDGKSYPYIKITTGDPILQIAVTRKILADKALYFGPYPDATAVHGLLKIFRKTFTYCTHVKPYSSCLYVHLGLCPLPFTKISRRNYRKNIRYMINILQGKRELIENKLQKDLTDAIKKEKFEAAAILNRQIAGVKNLTQQKISSETYLSDPLILSKKRSEELSALIAILNKNGVPLNRAERIECYDISNIMGTNPTGSMVVLKNGEPEKKEYKRFKIKYVRGINDFLMIKEVVKRRLNHPEWGKPDLLIIDGGFIQLKFAKEAIVEAQENLPVISLAKRQEQICLSSGKMLTIDHDSPALHVLQRVRDEAHRFAKKYHTHLRMKQFQELLEKR